MKKATAESYLEEAQEYFETKLLPFWLDRCKDTEHGGFITHFDQDGNDSGEDEKSMLAQARTIYSMSAAHRHGYGDGVCAEFARHGVDFLLDKFWDDEYGGFYWLSDRRGDITIEKKIMYGLGFTIYALSEYTMATDDPAGLEYAERVFDLVKKYATDTMYGGYFEMFERNWDVCGPGSQGGDRKTLDVHMHLMEAFTWLLEASGETIHHRTLQEVIDILTHRILHPEYRTGIPQFTIDWQVAPQIKFDIVWGWDRFTEDGVKDHPEDNTSAGHNAEFAWLLLRAMDVMGQDRSRYRELVRTIFDHVVANGIDDEYGGVYVEGPHSGGVYDREKEFWQQAEVMIGMLEAYLMFEDEQYWQAYENVHRFVFDKMIHHEVGEWWPLLSRKGEVIWTHMSHSWKVNYHTIRCMIETIERLKKIRETL